MLGFLVITVVVIGMLGLGLYRNGRSVVFRLGNRLDKLSRVETS